MVSVLVVGLSKVSRLQVIFCFISKSNNMYAITLSVKSNYSVLFNQWQGEYSLNRSMSEKSLNNLKNNNTGGKISKKVASKMSVIIDWFVLMSRKKVGVLSKGNKKVSFKASLITLTLSSKQIHSDEVIKRELLNAFLVESGRLWGLKNYVWKAEKQKNGNIHFHIVSDVFVDCLALRQKWNQIQNKLGYVDRFGLHNNPNSTDVHSLRNVRNVASYMRKYLVKSDLGNGVVSGRLWGCSRKLSKIPKFQIVLSTEQLSELRGFCRKNRFVWSLKDRCCVIYSGVADMVNRFSFVYRHFKGYFWHYENFLNQSIINEKKEVLCKNLAKSDKCCVNQNGVQLSLSLSV